MPPTGVSLNDPREALFAAAERVLVRDGGVALTSRAVTEEGGVAKGVLHKYFSDFDTFLAELIISRTAYVATIADELARTAGRNEVEENLAAAMSRLFETPAIQYIKIAIARDEVRKHLVALGQERLPILLQAVAAVSSYIGAEQRAGRIRRDANPAAVAPMLVGALHLLATDEPTAATDYARVRELVVEAIRR
ncbi:TetR family transcriptional regulator [Kribbella karoonensis]|uniref:TetR family transcriptional regulator n=1 Tax=Kribbella karoonensis TaxID=324851 RepID=A0ABP4PI42_9ACTN